MGRSRILVVGGGPAGLFLARLVRLHDRDVEVVVYERNAADATFGFGVVFSDRTMTEFREADPATHQRILEASVRWTDMEIRHLGEAIRYGGYGFTAISRIALLRILQEQAREVGAVLRFRDELSAADLTAAAGEGGVVAVADGANSAVRDAFADRFGTSVEAAGARYIWFGTPARFDVVTFPFVETRFGSFAAHAYPYAAGRSTFIVEADEQTWRAAGMDESTAAARGQGQSDMYAKALMEDAFAEHLDGQPLLVNNSKWAAFRMVTNRRWSWGSTVLLGDAAHTAHFSVGSGTKMAMEDAIALARALRESSSTGDAFSRYESDRRPEVERVQGWAAPSMRWWETFGTRMHLPPRQFGFHFLTRTRAIGYGGLRRRHPDRIDDVERWFTAGTAGVVARPTPDRSSGLATPLRLGTVVLPNRVVAVTPPDHDGARVHPAAVGLAAAGAGLVVLNWTAGVELGSGDERERWRLTVRDIERTGAVAMAALAPGDHAAQDLAAAAGLRLVEVVCPDEGDERSRLTCVERLSHRFTVVTGLVCPADPPWSVAGHRLVEHCRELALAGGSAVHLRGGPTDATGPWWDGPVAHADRVRAATRGCVLVDGPQGWATRLPGAGADDGWATRLHVAVLSGRIDLVAAWPLDARGHGVPPAGRPVPRATVAAAAAR